MKKVLLTAMIVIAGVSLNSCSSSNDNESFNMNERAITMQRGDKYTITHTGNASWVSESNFIASVDNDGTVTANRVGETCIYAMSNGNKYSCEVTVNGAYNYFREPLCKVGATPEDVMKYEKRSLDTKKSDRTLLIYYPAQNESANVVSYTFKNDKLENAFVTISMNGNSVQALEMGINFISERYYGGKASNGYVFYDANTKNEASKQVFVSNAIPGYEGVTAILYTPLK